jgi:FMN reductase
MSRRIAVVTAGLSQPSSTRMLADRLGAATTSALRDRGVDGQVEVVELRDYAHELTDNLLTGFPSTRLGEVVESVVTADALVAVTPIFTGSYSGLFKTFFDVLDKDSLAGMPVLIAATGGTARHSLALEHALRPMFTYLHATVVPTSVYAASEDWGSAGGDRALSDRIDRAADELAALVAGTGAGRREAETVDPFEEPTPFVDLLAGRLTS